MDLSDIIISMRSHGWDRDWSKNKQKENREKYNINEFDALYTFYYPGFNLRSTDLQAVIGLSQIEKLDGYSNNRSDNFKLYNERITGNKLNITINDKSLVSNFAFPIVSEHRDNIVKD